MNTAGQDRRPILPMRESLAAIIPGCSPLPIAEDMKAVTVPRMNESLRSHFSVENKLPAASPTGFDYRIRPS